MYAQSLDVVRCARGHNMELLQTFRWLKVRYEGWVDHVGVLPRYDAPKKRAGTKTGDLKPSSGGTPLGSRYYVRGPTQKGAAASRMLPAATFMAVMVHAALKVVPPSCARNPPTG